MKIRTVISSVLAAGALLPVLAHASDSESLQRCMETFAAQHFPDSNVSFVVNDDSFTTMPLIARTGTQEVRLVASSKRSGRVLATTTCQVKSGAKQEGSVVVLPPST